MNKYSLAISIVSHGHGAMVWRLVSQFSELREVSVIVVTLNLPEDTPDTLADKVIVIRNKIPKGFGANHNQAFSLVPCEVFCVVNPDIELIANPLLTLCAALKEEKVGISAPIVFDTFGNTEDSLRSFLTPLSVLKRVLNMKTPESKPRDNQQDLYPDWIAGMFMAFSGSTYQILRGFDERYFMYCEDADICTRAWKLGLKVIACHNARVIHRSQRASHKNIRHFLWHVHSLLRYFIIHNLSLPQTTVSNLNKIKN